MSESKNAPTQAMSASSALLDTLRAQMDAGFNRRSEPFVRRIFEQHKDSGSPGILIHNLVSALADLGIYIDGSESEKIFKAHDLNENGCIDLSEFAAIAETARGVECWASTLPLAQLLADCLPMKNMADPVRAVSRLCETDIQVIATCFGEGVRRMLREEVEKLRCAYARLQHNVEGESSAKFTLSEMPEMECGSIKDFVALRTFCREFVYTL
jgi:hypothetical protein